MIEQARFQNYRSLKAVTVRLGTMTVLVGPNGCGKSSLMRGLGTELALVHEDIWQHSSTMRAEVELGYADGRRLVRSIDSRNQEIVQGSAHVSQLLHLDLQQLRSPNKALAAPRLTTSGSNLANAFFTLTRREREELARQFCELIPTFSDVDVVPLSEGKLHLQFQDRWAPSTWYTAQNVSDGTMLVLAYLVLQYQREKLDLILIEEPERGLHPYLLRSLVEFLRRLASGEVGPRAIQIVLATHSADLLDHVLPEEARFLTRDPGDGSVRVDTIPAAEPGWQSAFRAYDGSLGAMWKSGGLSGVPGD